MSKMAIVHNICYYDNKYTDVPMYCISLHMHTYTYMHSKLNSKIKSVHVSFHTCQCSLCQMNVNLPFIPFIPHAL